MSKKTFFCKNVCGDPDFCIHEWNVVERYCNENGIEGEERDRILHPELFPCEEQCQSCIDTVLDTQLKYRRLREKRELNKEINRLKERREMAAFQRKITTQLLTVMEYDMEIEAIDRRLWQLEYKLKRNEQG